LFGHTFLATRHGWWGDTYQDTPNKRSLQTLTYIGQCICGVMERRYAFWKEADKRALKGRGWDYDRAVEHIRKNIHEDAQGRKQLDVARANANV
jgi:hypothetical protein